MAWWTDLTFYLVAPIILAALAIAISVRTSLRRNKSDDEVITKEDYELENAALKARIKYLENKLRSK